MNKIKTGNRMSFKNETETHNWNISLNNSSNPNPNLKQHIIGKNITFYGNTKYLYRYKDTIVVGHGRIYNEQDLWINILKMHPPLNRIHPLVIVIELYNKFGFEKTIEYLDGDFSFVFLDFNLYGDESIIYVVKDSFGLCPLYQWTSKNSMSASSPNSKKVQFQDDTIEQQKQYVFSSSTYMNEPMENMNAEPISNGNYHIFTHSFKVSANWKLKRICKYYTLPFYSTYEDEDEIRYGDTLNQIQVAVNKRIKYILNYENVFYITQLQNTLLLEDAQINMDNKTSKIKIATISFEDDKMNYEYSNVFQFLQKNETKYSSEMECVKINIVGKNILELEEQYPNIIHNLKTGLNTSDPSVIRAYFIPWMIAKHIKETEPEIKYVFMGEPFVSKWISTNVFDRREELNDAFFLEKIKGWISGFFEYNIELIIPFLDRILIQKI